eukprot:6797967-Pyramimonas_sp.AAC.1
MRSATGRVVVINLRIAGDALDMGDSPVDVLHVDHASTTSEPLVPRAPDASRAALWLARDLGERRGEGSGRAHANRAQLDSAQALGALVDAVATGHQSEDGCAVPRLGEARLARCFTMSLRFGARHAL